MGKITFDEALKRALEQIMDEEVKTFLTLPESEEKIVIDVTGTPLAPGHPKMCLGNGDFPGFECCCDECNYLMDCAGKFRSPNMP